MKRCPDCASDVPDEAKVCAHCGHRWMNWWDAKAPVGFGLRLVAFLVAAAVIYSFLTNFP